MRLVSAGQLFGVPRLGRRRQRQAGAGGHGHAREKMSLIGARPQHDTFGIANAMLVAPGEPERSVMRAAGSRTRPGADAAAGHRRVDEAAVATGPRLDRGLEAERPFVRAWQTRRSVAGRWRSLSDKRSAAAGKTRFRETGCTECHRLGGEGGTVGPDLTGDRQTPKAARSAGIDPAPVEDIPDQYATYAIEAADGQVSPVDRTRRQTAELVRRLTARPGQPMAIARSKSPTAKGWRIEHAGRDRQRLAERRNARPAGLSAGSAAQEKK